MLFVISGCRSQQQKQQVALEQAVNSMNEAIDRFIDDKDRSPRSLQELIVAGYLKEIPVDPVTRSSRTWLCLADDESPDDGILDVVVPAVIYDRSSNVERVSLGSEPERS